MIPFNKLYLTGNETEYIEQAVASGKISGDGIFTKRCHDFLEKKYGFRKCLLTTSCTDALEMAAILLDVKTDDEIIVPSYTFVSTANAFVLRGAKIIFADSYLNNPNIDADSIEKLITNKTKAIVVVHYAGMACDMDKIMELANKYKIFVIEDAAQAIDSFYISNGIKKTLGSIGHLATFSFHETKNIISGEGGLLVINDEKLLERVEIIREKGTNRSKFFRGEVKKYTWIDIGSSFLPSDIIAAFLFVQLESLEKIQIKRKQIWNYYYEKLKVLEGYDLAKLPDIPEYAINNAHMFYIICKNLEERTALINYLKGNNICAVFHYVSLHQSGYYKDKYIGKDLPNSDIFTNCLVRLPFYYELTTTELNKIVKTILSFYKL